MDGKTMTTEADDIRWAEAEFDNIECIVAGGKIHDLKEFKGE